ncbi:carbohydrate kinase family protein [Thermogladius sp. KZ2Tp1]|uniref:carbohydrate kinase family protein n=1 Tax=Thermogladius sp. KZ2Tp1 TaxID=3136289 RepID=UPI003DA8FD4D
MVEVVGLGEVCIDWTVKVKRFPETDEKIYIEDKQIFPGGVTANFTVGLARLGVNVAFVGGVGEDDFGRFLIKALEKEGVDTSLLLVRRDARTPVNIIVVNEKGEKQAYMDPFLKLNVPDFHEIRDGLEKMLSEAKVLHTSAIKIQPSLEAAKIAKKKKAAVTFDLEKHVAIEYGLEGLKPLLENVDILMPNKEGLKTLTKKESLVEAAKEMLKYGPRVVVVTRGEKGSLIVHENGVIETPAFPINPVDTTGAGDAFNAGFVYAYFLRQLDLKDAAIVANAVAALKCLKLGAQTGMPRLHELREFLQKRGLQLNL